MAREQNNLTRSRAALSRYTIRILGNHKGCPYISSASPAALRELRSLLQGICSIGPVLPQDLVKQLRRCAEVGCSKPIG
jgi:hypothetical protein